MFRTSLDIFNLIIPGIFHKMILIEGASVSKFHHFLVAQQNFHMNLLSRGGNSWDNVYIHPSNQPVTPCTVNSLDVPSVGWGVCVVEREKGTLFRATQSFLAFLSLTVIAISLELSPGL